MIRALSSLRCLALILSAALSCLSARAQPVVCPPECTPHPAAYEVRDLGTLGGTRSQGFGINDAGQVVGSSTTAGDSATHAFLYAQGTLSDLGTLGGSTSIAYAINASGKIVGYANLADGSVHATLWSGTTPTDLGTNGAAASYATAINTAGQIVGFVSSGDSQPCIVDTSKRATLWDGTSVVTLPINLANGDNLSAALGISDAGQVVGCAQNASNFNLPYPTLWTSSTALYTPLGSAGWGGAGRAIIGSVSVGEVLQTSSPFQALWNATALTYLGQLATGGGTGGTAYALNASGLAVGTTLQSTIAALWLPSDYNSFRAGIDLNLTLRPQVAPTVLLSEARAINTSGLIVVNGTLSANGQTHAFLLTPATAAGPPSVTLSANPTTVLTGQSYALTWSSMNAWACSAGGSGPNGAPWSGLLATSGTKMIQAGSTAGVATATLSCSFGNQSGQTQTTITLNYPPVTVSLAASPTSIMSGQSTTLTWTSANATGCTASGGGSGDGWAGTTRATGGSVAVTEPVVVAAPLTVTFTLTCNSPTTNQSGAAAAQVVVSPPPQSGGGGALDLWSVLGLITVGAVRLLSTGLGAPHENRARVA